MGPIRLWSHLSLGPKQSDWFKASFLLNRFSENHFIIEDVRVYVITSHYVL